MGTLLVAMPGGGIGRSEDEGNTWTRPGFGNGIHQNAVARTLIGDPRSPSIVFCGCDKGILRSEDGGRNWQLLDNTLKGKQVWKMAVDPVDPDIMFAGTGCPDVPAIFRSRDGGQSWQQRPMEASPNCAIGIPQTTCIVVDPTNHNSVWVGIEVDGLRHSTDGGETFRTVTNQEANGQGHVIDDIHDLAISGSGPDKTLLVLVGGGGTHEPEFWTSNDEGNSWDCFDARANLPCLGQIDGRRNYPRGLTVKPGDPTTVFMTLGDNTPGRTGAVLRSHDSGHTWENLDLPTPPNSAVWTVTVPAAEPSKVFAGTRYGYLYSSNDGGGSWSKLWREFSEIASILWLPN